MNIAVTDCPVRAKAPLQWNATGNEGITVRRTGGSVRDEDVISQQRTNAKARKEISS